MDVNPTTNSEDMVLKRVFYALLHYRLHCSCFSSFPFVHTSIIMFYFHFFQSAVHLFHFIYHSTSHSHLPYLMAICKSRNGESGNGMRGMMAWGESGRKWGESGWKWWESGWECGNAGNQGGNDGNAGIQGENAGNAGNQGGNEGNKGENLRIGVKLTNYNCGEGEKQKERCAFIKI